MVGIGAIRSSTAWMWCSPGPCRPRGRGRRPRPASRWRGRRAPASTSGSGCVPGAECRRAASSTFPSVSWVARIDAPGGHRSSPPRRRRACTPRGRRRPRTSARAPSGPGCGRRHNRPGSGRAARSPRRPRRTVGGDAVVVLREAEELAAALGPPCRTSARRSARIRSVSYCGDAMKRYGISSGRRHLDAPVSSPFT